MSFLAHCICLSESEAIVLSVLSAQTLLTLNLMAQIYTTNEQRQNQSIFPAFIPSPKSAHFVNICHCVFSMLSVDTFLTFSFALTHLLYNDYKQRLRQNIAG